MLNSNTEVFRLKTRSNKHLSSVKCAEFVFQTVPCTIFTGWLFLYIKWAVFQLYSYHNAYC